MKQLTTECIIADYRNESSSTFTSNALTTFIKFTLHEKLSIHKVHSSNMGITNRKSPTRSNIFIYQPFSYQFFEHQMRINHFKGKRINCLIKLGQHNFHDQ